MISEHKQKLNQTCLTHENEPHWLSVQFAVFIMLRTRLIMNLYILRIITISSLK